MKRFDTWLWWSLFGFSGLLTGPASAGSPPAPVAGSEIQRQWLVILASNRDETQAVPALDILRAHPELGARPLRIDSGHYRNLMPCYAVTAALATPEKKVALALSAKLRALGVDNYVKNVGDYVGASTAMNAWCTAQRNPAPSSEDVRLAVRSGDALWAPLSASAEEIQAARAGAPAPVSTSPKFDAWYQPANGRSAQGQGKRIRAIDAASGQTRDCTAGERGILILGTPHFGVLETPGGLTAPACGDPALFEKLTCDGPISEGQWLAVPAKRPVSVFAPVPVDVVARLDSPASLEAAATAAVRRGTDWASAGEGGVEVAATERSVSVTWWGDGDRLYTVVHALREIPPGMCGGEASSWIGVFAMADSGLGPQLGGWVRRSYADVAGLIDLGADGRPEVVLRQPFSEASVVDLSDTVVAQHTPAFCDCPC